MNYTRESPTDPGWYWARNIGDLPGQVWEAVVRIDREEQGLVASWMTRPGQCGRLHERYWSPGCLWAGPIEPPTVGDDLTAITHPPLGYLGEEYSACCNYAVQDGKCSKCYRPVPER